jgi:hypothetical protein
MMREVFANELSEELNATALSSEQSFSDESSGRFARLHRLLQTNKFVLAYFAPRGFGLNPWTGDARKQTQIRRRYMLLGETLEGMRVWDIRRGIQALRAWEPWRKTPLVLQAEGDLACDALYAALFEPGVAGLELWQLPASHMAGPDYLNVLRVLDIPQAVAMAADRCQIKLHETRRQAWEFPLKVTSMLGWGEARLSIEVME